MSLASLFFVEILTTRAVLTTLQSATPIMTCSPHPMSISQATMQLQLSATTRQNSAAADTRSSTPGEQAGAKAVLPGFPKAFSPHTATISTG